MTPIHWAVEHHVFAVFMDLLVLWFAAAVLRQRRPTGSAVAWLLAILLAPYLGIPLFLMFGGRKFQLKARSKSAIPVPASTPETSSRSGERGPADSWALGPQDSADAVEWLDDGVRAYEALLGEILRAKRSIRIVTFVVGNDATGIAILEALASRARDGVEVRLLLDDLLSFEAPHGALARFKAAGGRLERFMPLLHLPFRGQANLRNHRKIAVFDGERAIVGGTNLAGEYMGPKPRADRWRDLSILLTGRAVATLDAIFRADWEFASGEALAPLDATRTPGPVPIRVVPSGPDSASDPIYDALLTMIFRAQRRFWVSTPYFVPDEPLARALAVAARRGVDVLVAVPTRSNHPLADLVAGPYLRELAKAGVEVRRVPGMLHAKTVLMDDSVAVMGSANFDMRSLFLDYEVALFFTGSAEISYMASWFQDTIRDCAKGPPMAGPLRSGLESVARLLAPLI
jgi:cardiolipin synthase